MIAIYSLSIGDVIKKEKAIPNGTPALTKPIKKGIDEQVQKGVNAPNKDAIILPTGPFCFDNIFFIFLFDT